MKRNKMKLLYFALTCILLFSVLSTVALAIPEELAWVLSDDETELYYGSKTFTLYEPYFPLTIVGDRVYGYDYALNDYRSVDTNDRNAVYAEVGVLRYVTEEGTSALDRLMEGEASSYMLMSQYGACGEISDDLAAKLTQPEKGAETRTFDVRDLEDALYYTLLGVESYGFYGCAYGAVYLYESEYYYIHYMDLGNQYFDSYGNFSYRRGTVEAVKLSAEIIPELQYAEKDMEYRPLEYIDLGENGNFDPGTDDLFSARSAFSTGMVFFGIMAPIPFLVIGLVFPRSHRKGYPKYWYILAGVAGLWMLLAILLMILVP